MIRMIPTGVATSITGPGSPRSFCASALISPALGEPRISQAIAPTNGERNRGAMMQPSSSGFAGRFVRAISQAIATPVIVAMTPTSAAIATVEAMACR